jgi:hypothetical protein
MSSAENGSFLVALQLSAGRSSGHESDVVNDDDLFATVASHAPQKHPVLAVRGEINAEDVRHQVAVLAHSLVAGVELKLVEDVVGVPDHTPAGQFGVAAFGGGFEDEALTSSPS